MHRHPSLGTSAGGQFLASVRMGRSVANRAP
ncbi:hypothetical protein OOU_Y34scaffold00487g63 [Pyricularia oryzae Y34]|uniref:Uncharacterized protein n=1 Tax=Pyricularia oryzae (strain Y34) TaxID=1143189 RepID=A0AA97P0F8_PYRO3|nr:hypothetical protein OOU_Y34scaffold00487g63 [Pyricularia oryzae Y34]